MKRIPILCHPTTVTMIDDNPRLLNSLALSLATHFKCRTFTSAIEGKNSLIKDYKALFQDRYLDVSCKNSILSFCLKTPDIHKRVYNDQRFSPSAIAIVDYDMPEMNGLELASELRKEVPHVKIILFTGRIDYAMVIDAFHDNKIDRFVEKGSSNYRETLISYVHELHQEFFLQSFANILEIATKQDNHPLKDPAYIAIFNQLIDENNIVEYYLLDNAGSFLMLNNTGKPTWLIARTERHMQLHYETAKEKGAASDILESLSKREKMVLFSNNNQGTPPFEKWYFHPAKKAENKEIYYCVIKGNESLLHLEKINSYKQFLLS